MARALAMRLWLRDRPERTIVVVSHGGFLEYLTQARDESHKSKGPPWANCEVRSYTFEDLDAWDAPLFETESSWRRRKGLINDEDFFL